MNCEQYLELRDTSESMRLPCGNKMDLNRQNTEYSHLIVTQACQRTAKTDGIGTKWDTFLVYFGSSRTEN